MKLVLASNNSGKLAEFRDLLPKDKFEIFTQATFNIEDADETGLTFIENAIIKARHAATLSHLPALADDSGLVIDALDGAPGIYSARFAGIHGDFQANIHKVLTELSHIPEDKRTARFICVLALLKHPNDPTPILCEGSWEGKILFKPSGSNGFGYDPIFWVPTHNCSAADLDPKVKNEISHRAQALEKLFHQIS